MRQRFDQSNRNKHIFKKYDRKNFKLKMNTSKQELELGAVEPRLRKRKENETNRSRAVDNGCVLHLCFAVSRNYIHSITGRLLPRRRNIFECGSNSR